MKTDLLKYIRKIKGGLYMYYYGNNAYYGNYGYQNPCCGTYVGQTYGNGIGAAIWIVLFILLVIIIGAGWSWGNNNNR